MRSMVSISFALSILFLVLCGVVQDSPLDEDGPRFVKPVIGIDTAASSIASNDTIRCDSAILVLVGNMPESRFQIKVDSLSWSLWKPAEAFVIKPLSDGKHIVSINTMYQNGIKIFTDSIVFFVKINGQMPIFPFMQDSVIALDTGAAINFSVIAEGLAPITYQWYKDSSILPGMTDNIFAIASFSLNDIGIYGMDTSRGFSLHFFRFKGGIKGVIVSSKNAGTISGAIATMSPGNAKNISNPDGVFKFEYLVGGTYSISIALSGYQEYTDADVLVSDSAINDLGVIVLVPNDTITANLKVRYDGNGNTGGIAPVDKNNYPAAAIVTIRGNSGNLVKTGYVFNGWNGKADGSGAGYSPGDTITMAGSDIILYATWKTQPTLTITYDDNGKTEGFAPVDSNKYGTGDFVVVLGNPGGLEKTGYSFAGWNTNADGAGVDYNAGSKFAMPSSSVTLFAKWTTNPTFSVIYFSSGADSGSVPPEGNYEVGALVTVSDNTGKLKKNSCVFSTWNTTADGTGTSYAAGATFSKGSVNDTLYAQWNCYSFIVTFDDQGATTPVNPASKTVFPPATTVGSLPVAPIKPGYNFGGWYTAINGGGTQFTESTVVTANSTVYAKWNSYSYTVTYDDQAATTPVYPKNQTVVSPTTIVGSLPTSPIKTGYIFGGWHTAVSGGGTEFTASTVVTANITVYAYWSSYAYTVTYDDQGATTPVYPTTQTVAAPSTTVGSLPTPPMKTGYIFGGWYPAINGGGTQFTGSTAVTANSTVYAKWNSYSFTVIFDDQGATTPVTPGTKIIISPATTAGPLPTPIKTGNTFGGWWYNAPNGSWTVFTASTVVTANTTVYAKWTSIQYTVTFNSQGGSAVASQSVNYGALATQPAATYRTGYTYGGWFKEAGCINYWNFATEKVYGNVTLYAKWTINQYTVTFNSQGGSAVASQPVNYGGHATTPTAPTRTGYTFGGWFKEAGCTNQWVFASEIINGNVTIYAKWTPTITATSGANGAISPSGSITVTSGTDKTFTITPSTNYHIDDVIVDGDSKGAVVTYTFTNVTSPHSISASFTINTYTITAASSANGAISPSGSIAVAYGTDKTFTITPSTNYHIDGVLVDGESKGAVGTYLFTNVTAAHSISATFAINPKITASAGANGSISPSGDVFVTPNTDKTFTITPATNYHIADVVVDDDSKGAVGTYTFTNVTAAHTISVSFVINSKITASAGANGAISPSGNVFVNYKGSQTFTITPADGTFEIDDVVVDEVSKGAVGTYTFTNVIADHSISATFKVK